MRIAPLKTSLFLFLFLLLIHCGLAQESWKTQLTEFGERAEKARLEWATPAMAIAVIHDDELVWWRGFGEQSQGKTPDKKTVFAIGSTTKAFAAFTLAKVIEQSPAEWDSRVSDLVPEFAMMDPYVSKELRVLDLLAQRPGIPTQALSNWGVIGMQKADLVKLLRYVEPTSSFRSQHNYVNALHLVAERVVEEMSGEPDWMTFLQKHLLSPLGMSSTTATAEEFLASPNRAEGHIRVEGRVKEIEPGNFPYAFGAAGALNSNLADMSQWLRLMLGGGAVDGERLVSPQALGPVFLPRTPMGASHFYCNGWIKDFRLTRPIFWHNGGTPGHKTFVGMDFEAKVGIVILSNQGGNCLLPDALGREFFDMVQGRPHVAYSHKFLETVQTAKDEPRHFVPLAVEDMEKLTGEYFHPVLGRMSLRVREGDLVLELPTLKNALLLKYLGVHEFATIAQDAWTNDVGWEDVGDATFLFDRGVATGIELRLGDDGHYGGTIKVERIRP